MADINVIVLPDGTEYPVSDYYLPVVISNPTNGQVLKYDATNQVWYNGEDTSGSSILYGTSAPTSQLGTDGCLYVKYTEGTGGASDTVDALYAKLDGSWCQISTGGGGGTSSADQVSVDDTDLEYTADDVQEALEKIYKRITLAEYEQLSQAEKYNGTIYFITDVKGANQRLTKQISNQAIASFETDLAENLENLEVAITATGGGGTPVSPIAINGFSACDLVACGKNLFDSSTLRAGDYDGSNPTIRVSQNLSDRIKCVAGTTYTFSFITGDNNGVAILVTNENNVIIETINLRVYDSITFTPTTSGYLTISFLKGTGYPWGTITPIDCQNLNPMIEISDRATTYEPYNGTTETISFGQTVYGGRLNVGSGVLTVTHQAYTYVGDISESWGKNGNYYYTPLNALYKTSFTVIADRYKGVAPTPYANLNNFECAMSDVLNHLNIRDDNGYATADDFRTWLSSNNLTVVYKYVTPIEIQLDSKQIQAIIGTNNVYSDTGDIIDLKFILSVGKAIS